MSKLKSLILAGAFALSCSVDALELPSPAKLSKEGALSIEEVTLSVHHFDESWKGSDQAHGAVQPTEGLAATNEGFLSVQGKYTTRSEAKFDFQEKATPQKDGSIKMEYKVSSAEGIDSSELSVEITLPLNRFSGRTLLADGKPYVLPVEYSEASWKPLQGPAFKSLTIPLDAGKLTISGEFPLLVQDNRKFNADNYSVRIGFSPKSGKITAASLSLDVVYAPFQFSLLDFSKAVNMGFKDDAADDQKGGWTDQGPENDLRMIKPGEQVLGGVRFKIVSPDENGGKSCVVLAGADRPYFPKEASVPAKGSFKYLYLLHAAAWYANASGVEVGKALVSYKDGSSQAISIGALDIGDWWAPESRKNGSVVWTGENKSSYVGLFLSKFEIDGSKELSGVSFKSSGSPVWAIVAASASNDEVQLASSHPVYIVENSVWKAAKNWKDVEKDSALDFSSLLDAPAGKHGFVRSKDGKFVFEDGTPVKFYGVNLCGSANFLEKDWCEKFADRVARMGYNAIRFHHCDHGMSKRGPDTTELDPVNMDRIDYLMACLKKRGVYSTIDLYISRPLAKGEIPEFPNVSIGRLEFKGLAFIMESVMKNFEAFSRNLLTHVNPYTGLAWNNDPAIMGISLINEDTIFGEYSRKPEIKALYDGLFETWLKDRKIEPSSNVEREAFKRKFLVELYDKAYVRMSSFVKSLGTKPLLTDLNHWSSVPMCLMRDNFEYVDNHFYWDHPRFLVTDWKLPSASKNTSALAEYASVPGWTLPSRIFGKAFTITEFDYSNPNELSAEGGAITGAYAALQGWDALYRFAYAHSSDNIKDDNIKGGYFDIGADPVKSLSERMAIMLFLRGDAKASEIAYPTLVSKGCLDDSSTSGNYPKEIWRLGLVGRSGSIVVKDGKEISLPKGTMAVTAVESSLAGAKCGKEVFVASKERDILKELVDNGAIPKGLVDLEKGVYRSSTKEIELNAKAQTFKAVTPRSESLIVPEGMTVEGEVLKVENKLSRGVFFAAAVDNAPLASCKRALILHLTDSQMTKAKFANEKMTVLESQGEAPCLVRTGKAKLTLKGEFQGFKLYSLEVTGKRIAEVPLKRDAGSVSFEADVLAKGGPVLAYELVKE